MVLWNMFSELEQTEGLIQSGAVSPEEIPALDALASQLEARISPPQELDSVCPDTLPRDELYYVLNRYLENARTLSGQAPPPVPVAI